MAHNSYPAGTPGGTVPSFYVVPSTDWKTVIDQCYASINGDAGGTWAPLAFITIGGAGLQLTGTGHRIAASARLNVESTGEIRLKNGALLLADGSAGDIRLEVDSNVAKLTAQTGSLITLDFGGAFDVAGGVAVKNTGIITWESSGSAIFSSGAILTAASGSTVNLSGTTNVRGAFVLKASGGPGSFTQEAGTTALFQGDTVFSGASSITYNSGAEVNGLITRKGTEVRDGATARTAKRPTVTLSASANEDVTVEADDYRVPQTLTGSRTYTVRHTGTVPREGEEIWLYRTGTTTPSAHTALFVREDSTVIAAFFNSRQGWFRLKFDGTGWQCVGGGQYASGDTGCGYYDNVW